MKGTAGDVDSELQGGSGQDTESIPLPRLELDGDEIERRDDPQMAAADFFQPLGHEAHLAMVASQQDHDRIRFCKRVDPQNERVVLKGMHGSESEGVQHERAHPQKNGEADDVVQGGHKDARR